jgi:hypothetical protein
MAYSGFVRRVLAQVGIAPYSLTGELFFTALRGLRKGRHPALAAEAMTEW